MTATTAPARANPLGTITAKLELDTRLIGMLAALAIIWVGFDLLSGGVFLTPRNLWNLSVQTASVAVMATGMVLIIVTRNIDLSVGAILGFVGMVVGVVQARWLPGMLGFDHWLTAPIAVLVAVVTGGLIGLFHGWLIAYLAIPPSSSRSADCSCGAARPGGSPRARPWPPWTGASRCWAAASKGRSAPPRPGCWPPSPAGSSSSRSASRAAGACASAFPCAPAGPMR
jgi:hypothetical protein